MATNPRSTRDDARSLLRQMAAAVTPRTAVATPDPVQPCPKCNRLHVTTKGDPACRAHKRSGAPCGNPPMHGQTVCRMHGGSSPQARTAAKRNVAMAVAMTELSKLGGFVELEPADAMLAMVHEAAWNVALYRHLVQRLRVNDVDAGTGTIEGPADEGPWIDDIDRSELGAAIASRVDPGNWKAAAHVWVSMYDAERERLMRWSKACRDAGVDERQVALAEADGRRIVAMLLAGFDLMVTALVGTLGELVAAERLQEVLGALRREQLPDIVRKAIETTASEAS